MSGGVEGDLPGSGVDEAVVVAAQEQQVVEAGGSVVDPVDDVVGVAHQGWASTSREAAVLVAGDEGFPDRGGDEPAEPADVEDLAAGAQDDGDDLGVAADPAQGASGEVEAVLGGGLA